MVHHRFVAASGVPWLAPRSRRVIESLPPHAGQSNWMISPPPTRIAYKRWPWTSPTQRPQARRSAKRASGSAGSTSSSTTRATPTTHPSRPEMTRTSAPSSRPTSGCRQRLEGGHPVLQEQGGGLIMQFSSMGGRVGGSPGIASYQAAKFAIDGFSRVLRAETAPFGIKVIVVEPSGFRTDWAGSSMTVPPIPEEYARIRLASGGRWRFGRGPGPRRRNTLPGREAPRHSPQSASWGERDGGLDTARPRAPR